MELLKDHESTKVSQHQYPRVDVLNNMLQSLGTSSFESEEIVPFRKTAVLHFWP